MRRQDATLQAMEDLLIEAWELLMRSPDRERGWLKGGNAWPDIVREWWEYFDVDDVPRLQLNRREVTLRDRVFIDPDCLTTAIAPIKRPLVAVVLAMKARPGPGGFRWERVWEAMGGRESGMTSDGLRARYDSVLRQLSVIEAARAAAAGAALSGF